MEYHQDRFDDYSLLIFKENKLVAVLPANIEGEILYSHQGLTYGGLVFTKDLKFKSVLIIFKEILLYLNNNNISILNLKCLPSIYNKLPSEEIDYIMFLLEAELTRRDILSVIDNRERIKLSKDRREGVKRGIKNNLVIKEVDGFEVFWNSILAVNLKEKFNVKPVHSLTEINKLKKKFPKQIRQFNVYKDDKIVAGSTIFETEQVAHSQYISGNKEKNELGSLDFLHEYLINDVFKNKRFFDFGISNENKGKNINEGLLYWKESFGARTITQNFYTLKTSNYNLLNDVFL